MNYRDFISLRNEDQAYHTLTNGVYLGTNEDGDDIYQLYNFWVSVQENTKCFNYEASSTCPDMIASEILGTQEL